MFFSATGLESYLLSQKMSKRVREKEEDEIPEDDGEGVTLFDKKKRKKTHAASLDHSFENIGMDLAIRKVDTSKDKIQQPPLAADERKIIPRNPPPPPHPIGNREESAVIHSSAPHAPTSA